MVSNKPPPLRFPWCSHRTSQPIQPLAPPACTHRAARTTTAVGKKKTPTSFDRTGAQRKGHHWHGDARPVSTTPCRVGSSDRRIVRWGRRLPDVCFCRKRRKSERKQSEINSKTHKEKAVRKITKTRRNKSQERKIDTHAGIWKRKRNEEKNNACLLFPPNQALRRPAPTPVWGGGGGLSLFSFNGTMPF